MKKRKKRRRRNRYRTAEFAMTSPIKPIEETIADLADSSKPLLSSGLVELSNLSLEELKLFEQMWTTIKPKRRLDIMSRLVNLAEDNAKLDFDNIFRSSLNDQDDEVRAKAIEGLWESEDTSLVNLMVHLLEQDSSEKVQSAAAVALGKFVILAELEKLRACYKPKIEDVLLSIINDPTKSMEVKRRALEAVAPLSMPEVTKAITDAYQSNEPKLRISAVYAMGRNCDPSWLPALLKELASTDAEMRYEAAGACGELGERDAAPYLIELVGDADTEVQLVAIQALGKIGGSEAVECLEECLHSSSEAIRQVAGEALNELEVEEDPFSFKFESG